MPDALHDDPLALRSPALFAAFVRYLRWHMRRRFHAVRVARDGLPQVASGRPVIVYSNHPSWWDPMLYVLACASLLPGSAGYGPMEAAALRRYGLLRRLGVFAIEPATAAGAARFLRVGQRVLSRPGNSLWITAEGHFADARRRPVVLRPGLAHLARRVPGAVILPLALDYVFWNESRPEALLRFGPPLDPAARSIAAWSDVLAAALTATMDALADEGMTRDPALFTPLVQGGAGIGGVYDVWRRAAAWGRLQHFDASHEGRS